MNFKFSFNNLKNSTVIIVKLKNLKIYPTETFTKSWENRSKFLTNFMLSKSISAFGVDFFYSECHPGDTFERQTCTRSNRLPVMFNVLIAVSNCSY